MRGRANKDVSVLLAEWSGGNEASRDELMPLVYNQLRQLARRYMASERDGHSLQATALVNEAFLRLVDQREVQWQGRAHFFALASNMMRRILVDHARRHQYAKRGGGVRPEPLNEGLIAAGEKPADIVALDEALTRLAAIAPRKSEVVELRYFGGLTIEEVAEVLKVSQGTVRRDWTTAKAWLYRAIRDKVTGAP